MNEKNVSPRISVIVPVYNTEKYLPKCIESILAQDFADFELIMVDDHSSDDSRTICDGYAAKDARISTLINPKKGVSSARNFGISKARGKYVCFVDSDDRVENNYLSDFFRIEHPEGVGMVSQSLYGYHDNYSLLCVRHTRDIVCTDKFGEFIAGQDILDNGYPVSKLFDRETLISNKIVFPENIDYHEDHIFVLHYLLHLDWIILSRSHPYHYILHTGHSTLSSNEKTGKTQSLTSRMQIESLEKCRIKYNIVDEDYLKMRYSFSALYPMMRAIIHFNPRHYRAMARDLHAIKEPFGAYFKPYRAHHPKMVRTLCNTPLALLPLYFFYLDIKKAIIPKSVK